VIFETDNCRILVPVIDDGTVYPDMKIELDWQNFMSRLATSTDVAEFYETELKEVLKTQPPEISESYKIQGIMRLDKSVPARDDIYAIHLANGLFVPVKKSDDDNLPIEEGQEVYWDIDRKLVYGSKEPSLSMEMNYQDFEEVYQHLRYSFANWYAMLPPVGLKKEVSDILFRDGKPNHYITLYEKRQRLFIKIGTEILKWLDSSIPQHEKKASLKRVDCRLLVKDQCSNRCVWKSEANSCLLHVPEKYDVGTRQVNAKTLMIKRLIEELIRFPLKREELLKKKVSQYIKLTEAFLSGDQYILPESTVEWSELLRFEWRKDNSEKPKYAEEFSLIQGPSSQAQAQAQVQAQAQAQQHPLTQVLADAKDEESSVPTTAPAPPPATSPPSPTTTPPAPAPIWEIRPIPEVLVKYIKKDSEIKSVTYFASTTNSVLPLLETLGLSLEKLEEQGQSLESPILTNEEICKYVASQLKLSILQIAYEDDLPMNPKISMAIPSVDSITPLPFLIIMKSDDGSVGILSNSPDTIMPFDIKNIPKNIRIDIERRRRKIQFQLT
jgi:hypothetical protein